MLLNSRVQNKLNNVILEITPNNRQQSPPEFFCSSRKIEFRKKEKFFAMIVKSCRIARDSQVHKLPKLSVG